MFLTNIGIEFFVLFAFVITMVLAYYDKMEEYTNFEIRNRLGNYIVTSLKGTYLTIIYFIRNIVDSYFVFIY